MGLARKTRQLARRAGGPFIGAIGSQACRQSLLRVRSDFPFPLRAGFAKYRPPCPDQCGCGGIGRRAALRSLFFNRSESSSLFIRTNPGKGDLSQDARPDGPSFVIPCGVNPPSPQTARSRSAPGAWPDPAPRMQHLCRLTQKPAWRQIAVAARDPGRSLVLRRMATCRAADLRGHERKSGDPVPPCGQSGAGGGTG